MSKRFLAAPPGKQDETTVRQFRELEAYLFELERRLAPLTGRGLVDPIPSLDPVNYTLMSLSDSTIPEIDGVYWMSLRLSVAGSNNNAWIQLKATWGGIGGIPADEIEGDQVDVGNNDLMSVTLSGAVAIGINMQFWARGDSAQILTGRANVARIGTGDILRGQM